MLFLHVIYISIKNVSGIGLCISVHIYWVVFHHVFCVSVFSQLAHFSILTVFGFLFIYICLSDMSCFQGLFFCPEVASLLVHNFCIYHISPPGHEVSLTWVHLHNASLIFMNHYVFSQHFALPTNCSQSFFSGTFTRVLAVGSCSN